MQAGPTHVPSVFSSIVVIVQTLYTSVVSYLKFRSPLLSLTPVQNTEYRDGSRPIPPRFSSELVTVLQTDCLLIIGEVAWKDLFLH